MTQIAILKPGKHKPDAPYLSATDLKRIAESYDPKKHEAPMVIGHPKDNKPAVGWVERLDFRNNRLFATLKQVNKDFAKIVRDGAYKYVSAALYGPKAFANPTPGRFGLRHVGLFGSKPVAVRGLGPVSFGEGDDENDAVIIEFSVEDADEGEDDGDDGGIAELSESVNALSKKVTELEKRHMSDKTNKPASGDDENVNLAEREADLNKKAADLDKRQAALEKAEADAAQRENAEFVEGLVKEGKVLPRHKDGLVEFMSGLNDDQTVNFVASDSKSTTPAEGSARDFMEEFLNSLPEQVNYAEIAKAERALPKRAAKIKTPAGYEVGGSNVELAEKIDELMAQDGNLTYAEAVSKLEQH